MRSDYSYFTKMGADERAWVRELVERFAWPVDAACQQVHFFGVDRRWVYDYRNGVVLEQA